MKVTKPYRRGSVLMEFIVVLPIYLVLFGGTVMLGDMSLHAIRLTSRERTTCFDTDCKDPDRTDTNIFVDHFADTSISSPFAYSTGVKLRESYSLPRWMRGQLAYAYWFFNRALGTKDEIDDGGLYQTGGSVGMYTKSVNINEKIFYTLHRYDYSQKEDQYNGTLRSNRRPASDLLTRYEKGNRAWRAVYGEDWFESGRYGDDLNVPTTRKDPNVTPFGPSVRYRSYSGFDAFK